MREKKGGFLFIPLFVKGHFTCKSMEIAIIESAITLILEHYKAVILTSSKKLPIYFFMKFAQFEE